MKKETKIRIVFFVAMLCIIVHYFYYGRQGAISIPSEVIFLGLWSPLLMLYSILPSKKVRMPDYSKAFSVIGILISLCSFAGYLSCFLGIWSAADFTFFFFIIVACYFIFLSWYKNGWWG
jgi:hypothetical protein